VPGGIFDHMGIQRGAPADRWQERHLIALGQRRAGLGKTLVQGENQTGRHLTKPRKMSRIMLEDGVQARALGDLDQILADADNVTQYTEEQDADSHVYAVMVTDARPRSRFQEFHFSQL